MDELLFNVLKLVVIICAMLVTRYMIPWIKSLTENNKYALVADIVEEVVQFVEQVTAPDDNGATKKAKALAYIASLLSAKGIIVSDEQLNALLEAAVYTMNHAS